MSDVHVHRFGPDYLCVCGATPMDDLERENQALRKALERIARVPLEEDDYVPDGVMQEIARAALEGRESDV